MSAQQSIPWEQQALHIAIDTLQEALSGKPKEQQEALHMSLMTLRGFLAAQSSVDEEFPVAPTPTPRTSFGTWPTRCWASACDLGGTGQGQWAFSS